MIVRVRISKTIQERSYEPFVVDVEIEKELHENNNVKELVDKVEKVVDSKIDERLRSLED